MSSYDTMLDTSSVQPLTVDQVRNMTSISSGTVYIGGGGGGGGVGSLHSGYGAVPPVGGVSGSYTVPSGTITLPAGGTGYTTITQNSHMSTSILSIRSENGGDAIIKTNKNQINLDDIAETVAVLKERLLVLTPNFELHEKYPVLKDLYEQYKVVEAMLKEEEPK